MLTLLYSYGLYRYGAWRVVRVDPVISVHVATHMPTPLYMSLHMSAGILVDTSVHTSGHLSTSVSTYMRRVCAHAEHLGAVGREQRRMRGGGGGA